jgi:DNA-binding response OmpR family regulator
MEKNEGRIKLLLIEDEQTMGYMVKDILEKSIGGYEVDWVETGEAALERLQAYTPDIIVADINLPGMSGLQMVEKIRQTNEDIPILFATAKVNTEDEIMGFVAGGDNYIKKPYSPIALNEYVRALIKLKTGGAQRRKNALRTIGNYTFDPKNKALTYGDSKKRILTAKESQILALLLEHKGEVVQRDNILHAFWPKNIYPYSSRSLDVFISKLRKYFSQDPSVLIKNVKGVGIILDF